jgi:hypothetical protein
MTIALVLGIGLIVAGMVLLAVWGQGPYSAPVCPTSCHHSRSSLNQGRSWELSGPVPARR